MAIVNATIFFEKRFWVGTFERTDKEGYAVARHTWQLQYFIKFSERDFDFARIRYLFDISQR